MTHKVLVNGVAGASVDALDRGLQYGDGLFETLRLQSGKVRLFDLHLERLTDGCVRLDMRAPPADLLAREIAAVAPGPEAVVKVIVTRGLARRGYRPPQDPMQTRIVAGYPCPSFPDEWRDRGVRARLCSTRVADSPVLAGLKHLGRLEQVLARAEWQDESVAEGLMLDARGAVACGTQTNLFVEMNGTLRTPAVNRCGVAGVARRAALEWARARGQPAQEGPVRLADLLVADEVFLTNAVIGAWRIAELDGRSLGQTGCAREFRTWLDSR